MFNGAQVSFDEMIYIPAYWPLHFPKKEIVLVDEAQDLDPTQHILIAKTRPDVVISIGDPNQAIYGWRGAMSDSMDRMQETYSQRQHRLTYCFRCPRLSSRRPKTSCLTSNGQRELLWARSR